MRPGLLHSNSLIQKDLGGQTVKTNFIWQNGFRSSLHSGHPLLSDAKRASDDAMANPHLMQASTAIRMVNVLLSIPLEPQRLQN